MHFSTAVAVLASAAFVSAANMTVTVGDGGSLAFNPTSVNVAAGDTINFEFRAKNHSVTQSTFANPCQLMTTPKQGINSGFMPVAANATTFPAWSFTVDDPSTPLWFFCAQTIPANHCQAGMVFAVNPTADKTFDAFQTAAKASGGNATTSSGSAPPSSTTAAPGGGAAAGTTPGASTTSGFSTVVSGSPSTTTQSVNATSTGASGTNNNGALRMGGSAASILAVVGLVAGLAL